MPCGGIVGKILRLDLTTGATTYLDTNRYMPQFVGGEGIGFKILWDETSEKTTEWSPENPLIIMSGPLAGTGAPHAGRNAVVSLAPQGYPICWASSANFGGDFGVKLKFAGYDGMVLVGKATKPTYLFVSESGVQQIDARDLWGLDSEATKQSLLLKHGTDVSIVCIGPAGENLVRWASIEASFGNAAGQCGFGAIMGDKKIKAIVVKPGTQKIPISSPDKLLAEIQKINAITTIASPKKEYPNYVVRKASCAWAGCTGSHLGSACPVGSLAECGYYSHMPLKYTGQGTISRMAQCVGPYGVACATDVDVTGQVEISAYVSRLGLNMWELLEPSMLAFAAVCNKAGRLPAILGEKVTFNPDGPAVWPNPKTGYNAKLPPDLIVRWHEAAAYRTGEGDIWAEGTPRAAEKMGLSDLVWKTHKHGYGPHWDGRYHQWIHSPVWIVSAALWATADRDHAGGEHGFTKKFQNYVKEWYPTSPATIPYTDWVKAGAIIFGAQNACAGWDNPDLLYEDKEYTTLWFEHNRIIKNSVQLCDRMHPILLDLTKPAPYIGYTEAMANLYNAVVGLDWTHADLFKAAQRIANLRRAIHVRQGRSRVTDESVISYFEQPAYYPDEKPPQTIEVKKFQAMEDRYYEMRGWDKTNGWPTRSRLESLGLKDVADSLAALGKLGM